MGVYSEEMRNSINQWVEEQVAQVQDRRKFMGKDPVEKEKLTLFRYLAIYSRCVNPYSNKDSYRLDADLQAYLEMCVCKTLAKLVDVIETPEEPNNQLSN
jgi:hypothetical protein